MEYRGIEPKEGHDQSKQNCWEEVQVLCLFVEQGGMLDDG